jgi:hypothetical protein
VIRGDARFDVLRTLLSRWPLALLALGGVMPMHADAATFVPFRFIIDSQDLSGSDAACGPRQLSVNVFVNGVGSLRNLPGCTNPFACGSPATNEVYEVLIPTDLASVPIVIDISERDDPPCGGGDDHILKADLKADTRTGNITGGLTTFKSDGSANAATFLPEGATSVTAGGFGVGFRIEMTPAQICSTWPAAFVDSGLGESGLAGLGPQRAPASFASVVLKDGTNVLTPPGGQALDAAGCLDIHTFPKPGPGGWTLEQTSVLRRDGATVEVRTVAPAFRSQPPSNIFDLPKKFANSSSLTFSTVVRPGPGAVIEARPNVSGLDQEDVARVSAVLGRTLRAGLPLRAGVTVVAFAGDGCPSLDLQTDSCAPGSNLFVGPATTVGGTALPPQSQSKFIVAHEFGHVLQFVAAPNAAGEGYPIINGLPDSCDCRHVTVANQKHCLQSLEQPGDVRKEGFAHFIAARTFNEVTDANPMFIYYKEFLRPTCPVGATCKPFNGRFIQMPPIPVSALTPALWRNRNCAGTADLATEFDWLNFYWNVTVPGPFSVTVDQIFAVDRSQGTKIASNDAFLALAATVLPAAQANAFRVAGDAFGVSTDTSKK